MEINFDVKEIERIVCDYAKKNYKKDFVLKNWGDGIVVSEKTIDMESD